MGDREAGTGAAAGTGVTHELEARVRAALASVADPCCKDKGFSVVDMGLIEEIRRVDDTLELRVVLTTGWCPFTAYLFEEMKQAVREAVPEVRRVDVQVDWQTAWTPDRLSERAARELFFLPPPRRVGRAGEPRQATATVTNGRTTGMRSTDAEEGGCQ